MLAFVFLDAVLHDFFVNVAAAQVGITARRFNLYHPLLNLEQRDVESATTEVEHQNHSLLGQVLVESVGEGSRCRFVDNDLAVKAGDLASIKCRLLLRIVEVGRDCDYSSFDLRSCRLLGSFLDLLKNFCGHLFWRYTLLLPKKFHHDLRTVILSLLHVVGPLVLKFRDFSVPPAH